MFKVLSCIQSEHDLSLVALAAVICIFGCWISISLFDRALRSGSAGYDWVAVSGLIGGATIWSTHFISVLAFSNQVDTTYVPSITVMSLVSAFVSTTAGFAVAKFDRRYLLPEMGGAVVGLGGSLMHFVGMQAYHPAAAIFYDPSFSRASVVIGGALGSLALTTIVRKPIGMSRLAGTCFLAICVIGLHFVAMTAITIVPVGPLTGPAGLSGEALAIGISFVSALVIGVGFFAYSTDRRAKILADRDIAFASHHDLLTGLPNRAAFDEKVDLVLGQACLAGREVALHIVNIVHLSEINEVLGDQGGDQLLAVVAQRLETAMGPEAFLARLSGTRFALLTECRGTVSARSIAEELQKVLSPVAELIGRSVKLRFDMGVVAYPRDGAQRRQLMANADIALQRARNLAGNAICYYDEAMDKCLRRKRGLSQDLQNALESSQLELHFQPQCDLASMTVVGFEGLLRWRHPELGYISPAEFIPIAEETGIISPIGEWVLREGCAIAARWHDPVKVALNLSPVQFRSGNIREVVIEAIQLSGLSVARLELEITESTLIEDPAYVLSELQALKDFGVSVALDDFGSGYSSLATLSSFPFDKIKLDKSFLDWTRPKVQIEAIVEALLKMGQKLGMKILAEGVETEQQLSFLVIKGCDHAQGYLIGKPMPALEVDEWLRQFSGRTPIRGSLARLEAVG